MDTGNFIDKIRIFFSSGSGGRGSSHFHRERHNPKGGPDGGDGGKGGDIILRGNQNLWTLLHLRYLKHIKALDGQPGQAGLRTGRSGKNRIIEVPLGTIVRDEQTQLMELEITSHNQEKCLLPGGLGGRGNWHYRTSVRQSPKYAQPGIPGKKAWKILELKLLADIGLVGKPNAGKSTLLSVISAAKPKIDSYPFTTLAPSLGVVPYKDKSFVVADIPGIIEGASCGKGLGLRFLRHIERNSILLFILPADSTSLLREYELLLNELNDFSPELMQKPRILAITKADLVGVEQAELLARQLPTNVTTVVISALSNYNIDTLKNALWQAITA